MQFIQNLFVLISYTPFFTGFLFFFSWFVWILLKWFRQSHPGLSTMFIFSASVLIPYFRFLYTMRILCPELCPTGVTSDFIAEIVFWFVVFYGTKKLIERGRRSEK